jgi:hypothetical protein
MVPFSSLGLDCFNTNPLASPSVPGQGNWPAPLNQAAEQAFVAKSYWVPATGVTGVVGTVPVPETLISTHQDFVPPTPIPNGTPLAFLNFQ